MAGERHQSRGTSWKPSAQLAGIAFGLVGMVTGVAGLYIAWQTQSEQTDIKLTAYPSASEADLTHEGLGIRVELVNQSLRPVIIRSASLWRGSAKIGDAVGYVADVATLDRTNSDPAAVSRARLRFPITVDARAGRTFALLVDVWRPIVTAPTASAQRTARRALGDLLAVLSKLPERGPGLVQLRIDRAPGGSQWFPVRSTALRAVYPEAIKDASAATPEPQARLWVVGRIASGTTLEGLTIRRTLAAPDQAALVRLTIWKHGSPSSTSTKRPSIGQQLTTFPLRRLGRGAYVAVFEVGGKVIAHTSFAIPLSRGCTKDASSAASTPTWCGP